ncbi:hypothetical protein J14TS2_19840 [Bacillus sp. J14TS2]|uniref:DUF1861 family protein n=1 Tax=Bacillus sp. J14TS2 TaxID=2807188 RepID=UPI001B1AFBC1|nr:DUF1861 family protein [Bacillus sp. J14TS2]GIN71509.1 hypothetical protein J14TS2_19840 [Bacillus sp. J14TS2]
MNLKQKRKQFEKTKTIYESTKLTFNGVKGFDVYNTSIPFSYKGKSYLFGRIEKREEWARSWVRLFENTGKDEWTLVKDSMIHQLEDPYIAIIHGELVLGGTHVRYSQGKLDTFYGYFYRGHDINDLYYFTTGPDYMKDIRLVPLANNKIGIFSRPRSEEIRKKYGSESIVGFTTIDHLNELNAEVIENAPIIEGLFGDDEWGGCNQCYLLSSGYIGVIAHKCYHYRTDDGEDLMAYMNVSFVFDPKTHKLLDEKIIGTRSCYPQGPAKKSHLVDCAFTSGIVMRPDGKADLYSGIGDTEEGRLTIDYPFESYGEIIESEMKDT